MKGVSKRLEKLISINKQIINFVAFSFCGLLLAGNSVAEEYIDQYFEGYIAVDNNLKDEKLLVRWEGVGDALGSGDEINLKLKFYFKNKSYSDYSQSGEITFKNCDADSISSTESCVNGVYLNQDYLDLMGVLSRGFELASELENSENQETIKKFIRPQNTKNLTTHCWDFRNYERSQVFKNPEQTPTFTIPYCVEADALSQEREDKYFYFNLASAGNIANYFQKDLPGDVWRKLDLDSKVTHLASGADRVFKQFDVFRYVEYTNGQKAWIKDKLNVLMMERMHYSIKLHLVLGFTNNHNSINHEGERVIRFKWCSKKDIKKGSKKCAPGGAKVNKDYNALRDMLKRSIKISEVALQDDIKSSKELDSLLKAERCGKWEADWWRDWNPFLTIQYGKYRKYWKEGFKTAMGNWVAGQEATECVKNKIYMPLSTQKDLLDFLDEDLPGRTWTVIERNKETKALRKKREKERLDSALDGL